MTFQAAFYKGNASGLGAVYSVGVRLWTRSDFSHCEFKFSDGQWASASFLDGGVRFKSIIPHPDKWVYLDLPCEYEKPARDFAESQLGKGYDVLGNVGFVLGPVQDSPNRWFCSEFLMAGLGAYRPSQYHPGLAYSAIKFKFGL